MAKTRPKIVVSVQPAMNFEQYELSSIEVGDIYEQMQVELFDNLIKRLRERGPVDLEENPYVWQLHKLDQMNMLNEDNVRIISAQSGIAEKQLRHLIENEGLKIYEDTAETLTRYGKRRKPTQGQTNFVHDSLSALSSQAIGELQNMINSTLPASVQAVFRDVVQKTVAQVAAGISTPQKAMTETVMKWAERGFTGFVDAGGKHWKADAYARAVIKTTTRRTYNEMRTRPAREAGIDTFRYSTKSSAREMCAPLQGQIVTYGPAFEQDGIKVFSLADYGYGTAGGCLGVHCGHHLTPFVIGVNIFRPERIPDPEQAMANAELEARQRSLERNVRKAKERLHYAEQLGDADTIQKEKLRVKKAQSKVRQLVSDNEGLLHRDYSREKFYGS